MRPVTPIRWKLMQNTVVRRMLVCEFIQESNSFNPVLCGSDCFSSSGVNQGGALLQSNGLKGETVEGIHHTLKVRGVHVCDGIYMRSKSGGPVKQEVIDDFLQKMLTIIKADGPFEGIIVSLHGATISDKSMDVCGDILQSIRGWVGPKTIISVSCDLHANVTSKMMRNSDFICGYQTYPHLDHYSVGCRVATLACDKLEGRTLVNARVTLPIMAPAHANNTTQGKLRYLIERGHSLVATGKIVDFTIFQVQPWLDISEIASCVVVTAENTEASITYAKELAHKLFQFRLEIQGDTLSSIDEVVHLALQNDSGRPVVLVDSADSPNAGACGDSATVINHILKYKDSLRCAVTVLDKSAVMKAFSVGVNNKADFLLGASLAPQLSTPVLVKDAFIKSLHNGTFLLEGPAERGQMRNLGLCAVIEIGYVQILITSKSENAGDLQFYRGFGIEPTLCRLVSVKACSSLRASYDPISSQVINTDTPGAAGPNLLTLPFQHLPKPFYPFQEISEEHIGNPEVF